MPIELWWWVEPLVKTGFLTILILGIPGLMLEERRPGKPLPTILMVLALVPFAICACSAIVWMLTNILILIWR